MPNTYEYIGTPYTMYTGPEFSAANFVKIAIETPGKLPPGMTPADPLPLGSKVTIGDNSKQYSDLTPGQNGEDVTLSVRLTTDPEGKVTTWDVELNDSGLGDDNPPISSSYRIYSRNGVPVTPSPADGSELSVDPGVADFQGMSVRPGNWV